MVCQGCFCGEWETLLIAATTKAVRRAGVQKRKKQRKASGGVPLLCASGKGLGDGKCRLYPRQYRTGGINAIFTLNGKLLYDA